MTRDRLSGQATGDCSGSVRSSRTPSASERNRLRERLRKLDRQIGKLAWPIHTYRSFGYPVNGEKLIERRSRLDEHRKQTRNKLKGY